MFESARIFRLPLEADRVPGNAIGVYRFALRFPSDYELGLNGTDNNVEAARTQLRATLRSFHTAYAVSDFSGHLATSHLRQHLRTTYTLAASLTPMAEELIESQIGTPGLTHDQLKSITSVLRCALDHAIPLYIGMTARQSFRTRLEQHLDGRTGVSAALKANGMTWSQLWFECVPLSGISEDQIVGLEQLVQALVKPSFCRA